MARLNYLISGLPGTGKTTGCKELQSRGIRAIDADNAFGVQDKKAWIWQEDKIDHALSGVTDEVLFICGSASNRDKYMHRFAKVFILHVDDETLKSRLAKRTNNNFGKDPTVLARQLEFNQRVKEYSAKRGRTLIDATRPTTEIVDEILAEIATKTD